MIIAHKNEPTAFFNRDTELTLKRFRHNRGLKPTGVADRKTLDLVGL